MGSLQNTRMLRFLIVLTAVILTIFIYASYSTSQTLSPPPPMRTAAMIDNTRPLSNRFHNFEVVNTIVALNATAVNNHNQHKVNQTKTNIISYDGRPAAANTISHGHYNHHYDIVHDSQRLQHASDILSAKKKLVHHQHRQPTIDVGASDAISTDVAWHSKQYAQPTDHVNRSVIANLKTSDRQLNSYTPNQGQPVVQTENLSHSYQLQSQQQQQHQQMPTYTRNSDRYNNNNSELNKIPNSDVLIPSSNIQSFIEVAYQMFNNGSHIKPSDAIIATSAVNTQAPAATALDALASAATFDDPHYNATSKFSNYNVTNLARAQPLNQLTQSMVKAVLDGELSSTTALKTAIKVKSLEEKKSVQNFPSQQNITLLPKLRSAAVLKAPIDPSQGIPTYYIYESGHSNDELNINSLCPNNGADLKLLIIITSAQTHIEARMAIRQTWGHYGSRRDVATAFILGRTTNQTLNAALKQENFIYGDLIRGHFIDSYNNLTLKTISSLEWISQHCSKARFILKTDDDMFINIPKMLQFLEGHIKTRGVIYGRLAKKWKPIRNRKSKYYVSTGQFNATVFPPFTTGPAYVMSSDVVKDLYINALNQVYLKLEDVFITGIVAQQLGIKRIHVNEFLNRRIAFNACNIRKAISIHMIKPNEQFDLWKKLLDQTNKCK